MSTKSKWGLTPTFLADQDDITGAPRAVEDVAVFSSGSMGSDPFDFGPGEGRSAFGEDLVERARVEDAVGPGFELLGRGVLELAGDFG